jgi:hypothetical protein
MIKLCNTYGPKSLEEIGLSSSDHSSGELYLQLNEMLYFRSQLFHYADSLDPSHSLDKLLAEAHLKFISTFNRLTGLYS